jgi:heme oxygenase (biliverdin-IX-beta and delta-forming)
MWTMILLEALRSTTATAHRRLERRLALVEPDLSLARYRTIMAAMWGYHAPLETRLAAAGAWEMVGLDGSARQRVHQLHRDLVALHLTEAAIERLPRCERLPSVATPAEAMGCIYVIEGSTLGGRVVLRHVRRCVDVDVESGARFFAGYGEQTTARWRETCAAIARFDRRSRLIESASRSAMDTFASLEAWLEARGVLA